MRAKWRLVICGAAKHRVVRRAIEHVGRRAVTIDARRHRLIDQHGARLDVFDDALQFGIAIARIERDPGLACGEHRQNGDQMLDRILAADADARLRARVLRLEIGRNAHDLAPRAPRM